MGQKVHPYGLRLGHIKPWKARWFAKRDAGVVLMEDLKIREYLKKKLAIAGISSIEIDRASNRIRIRIFAAKPGVIIGRRGQEIDKIKEDLATMTKNEVFLDIKEVKMRPNIDDHDYDTKMKSVKKFIEEKSGKKIEVSLYLNSALGADRQITEGMQLGTIECGVIGTTNLANFEPKFNVFDLPFLFKDQKAAYKSIEAVMRAQSDLVEVLHTLRQVVCVKG